MNGKSPQKSSGNETQSSKSERKSFRDTLKTRFTPKAKAVLHMSLCMAVHFSGHELARGPTTSMFTSKEIGFQSAAALPLGLGLVSPFTIFVLWVSFEFCITFTIMYFTLFHFFLFRASACTVLCTPADIFQNAQQIWSQVCFSAIDVIWGFFSHHYWNLFEISDESRGWS